VKIKFLYIIFSLVVVQSVYCQSLLDRKINYAANNISIESAIKNISSQENITFSYQGNRNNLKRLISIQFNNAELRQVLDVLLANTDLVYIEFARQVLLINEVIEIKKQVIRGQVVDLANNEPVPYATIQFKKKRSGTVADINGFFNIEIGNDELNDSLCFYSIAYELVQLSVNIIVKEEEPVIKLKAQVIEIPLVEVSGKAVKFLKLGNHKWLSQGSLYMDTHGQQTALFIPNSDSLKGKIVKLNFYLSKHGNTDAPFRVHIYSRDSINGKPTSDLLPEMLVVKPTGGSGWNNVNIAKYLIDIPSNGFFVAMEGIFPNDYDFYYEGDGFKDISKKNNEDDDFAPESITYGQQLGYTKGSENFTWHYSIDHTWFQLKKRHFNVMISAEVKVDRKKWWGRIFRLFANSNKNIKK